MHYPKLTTVMKYSKRSRKTWFNKKRKSRNGLRSSAHAMDSASTVESMAQSIQASLEPQTLQTLSEPQPDSKDALQLRMDAALIVQRAWRAHKIWELINIKSFFKLSPDTPFQTYMALSCVRVAARVLQRLVRAHVAPVDPRSATLTIDDDGSLSPVPRKEHPFDERVLYITMYMCKLCPLTDPKTTLCKMFAVNLHKKITHVLRAVVEHTASTQHAKLFARSTTLMMRAYNDWYRDMDVHHTKILTFAESWGKARKHLQLTAHQCRVEQVTINITTPTNEQSVTDIFPQCRFELNAQKLDRASDVIDKLVLDAVKECIFAETRQLVMKTYTEVVKKYNQHDPPRSDGQPYDIAREIEYGRFMLSCIRASRAQLMGVGLRG